MRTFLSRIIGILEISGGFFGMVFMIRRLMPFGSTHDTVVAVVGLVLYTFVMIAGVLLIAGSPRGALLSEWAQVLQLPLIASPIFSYGFYCGGFVNVFTTLHLPAQLGLDYHFGSEGFVLAMAGPRLARLGVNVLALLSWVVLRFR